MFFYASTNNYITLVNSHITTRNTYIRYIFAFNYNLAETVRRFTYRRSFNVQAEFTYVNNEFDTR